MNIKINGKICEAEYGEYLINIAKRNGINIPTLCHSDALPGLATCRLCIVESIENGRSKIVTSCVYPVTNEIEVITDSEKIINMRKTIIMLLAARVPDNEYINKLKEEYSVSDVTRFSVDRSEQCVLCGLCVKACEGVGSCSISTVNRGITKKVSTPYDEPSAECIGCGSCAQVCPTGAIDIHEAKGTRTIWGKEFQLLSCTKCGKYFITREELEYMSKKLGTDAEELLCEKCKKHITAEKFKDIFENTSCK